MVTPLVHMGLGYDDLLVPALVHAGFETRDLVLVARTDANLSWVRRHAPQATVVRLPYREAREADVVSGLAPHGALRRACDGVGLDVVDLLVSERSVRRRPVDTAMNFLNLAAERIEEVVAGRGPVLALAEFTVTSELLTAGLVAHHGGLAAWPRSIRLPGERFGLLTTPLGVTLWQRQLPDPEAEQAGAQFLARWAEQADRPAGFARNMKVETPREIWRLASDRVRELALDRGNNLQLPRVPDYLRLPWLNPVKARLNLRAYRGRVWDAVPERYVFMPLHVQPESSVDVMGRDWRDQTYTARLLADALAPLGIGLAVKEHAHFMWRRDPAFWPPLDAHPNIASIDPHADSRVLATDAVFTVTATGTIGLESALRGLPVVCGAPMPWTVLGNVAHVPSPEELVSFVEQRAWTALHERPERVGEWFASEYVRNSWPGLVLDPPRVPAVLEQDNIQRVGAAFAEAAASLRPRPTSEVLAR